MNIDSLKTFVILADTKSFTKTAKLQYVVQATVSNRINELEKQVGKSLFIRDNKNVQLSNEGKAFLPYAKKIIKLRKEAIIKARGVNLYVDRLAIGMESSIYKGILTQPINELFLDNDDLAIKLKVSKSDEIIELLNDDILDIGIVYKRPKQSKLKVKEYMVDDIILVSKPREQRNVVSIDEVNHQSLIYAYLGENFFDWLSYQMDERPVIRFSSDDIESVIDYIKHGYGMGFVYRSMVKNELKSGELVELRIKDKKSPKQKLYIVISKARMKSVAVQRALEVLYKDK